LKTICRRIYEVWRKSSGILIVWPS